MGNISLSFGVVIEYNKGDPISIPHPKLILAIQSRSGEGFGFLATRHPDTEWKDHPYRVPEGELPLSRQPRHTNLYFSPLLFTESRRRNETVGTPGVLFADLDETNPLTLSIVPTVAWATSPGSFQAVWYLDTPTSDYTLWADVNKRLTYHTRADRGGWAGSKVLRVPGSYNWKRQEPTKLLWNRPDVVYTLEHLNTVLPRVGITKTDYTDHPPVNNTLQDLTTLYKHWHNILPSIRASLLKDRVQDRSLHTIRMAHVLHNSGCGSQTAFYLLWNAKVCKWRDRDYPQALWEEVERIWDV